MRELKDYYGDDFDYEKITTKQYGMQMVCEACGLSHVSDTQICPICYYEWSDGDDKDEFRERYFNSYIKKDAEKFRELKEKYQDEFGKEWKVKLQEDNFLWIVDKMEEIYKKL